MSTPKDLDNLFLSLLASLRPQARVHCSDTGLTWLPHLTSSLQPCFLLVSLFCLSLVLHFHFVLFVFIYLSTYLPITTYETSVPGIKLKSPGLCSEHIHLLSYLPGPLFSLKPQGDSLPLRPKKYKKESLAQIQGPSCVLAPAYVCSWASASSSQT